MRVLHITEVLEPAGIESFIMNMYRHIDVSKVQFDFFVTRNQEEYYDAEIAAMGGQKYCVDFTNTPNMISRVFKEAKALKVFLKEHPYPVVHIHTTTPLRMPYLIAAKQAGVKTRIIHSHSAKVDGKSCLKKCVYGIFKQLIPVYATECFGCSKVASEWMYPKRIWNKNDDVVFYNGIDTKKFSFSDTVREMYRKELQLGDSYVIVNTGRFLEQKNQAFLVDVFAEILKIEPNARLLFLGKGPLRKDVEKKVAQKGIGDKVQFLGVRNDVENVLQAADCYVMPSLYEGLPVSAVEAQSVGLPCVFSTNITKEVALCSNVTFLELSKSCSEWAKVILSYKGTKRDCKSDEIVRAHGYDVQDCANLLQGLYLESCKGEK